MASPSNGCTLEGGHDSLYEYQCSLCEEDGQQMEATKFCKECFVYMCDSCIQTKHNRFPLNKRHEMLAQTQFSTVKESSLRSFPTKRCPKHPGELINIYCGEHDDVCCIVCKTLEHSNCAKSQHLFDAAKGIHIKSKECQSIIKETETFLSDVKKVLNDGKAEMTRIAEAKEQVKNQIDDFRKRVDKYFDDLEAKCLCELQNLESKIIDEIERGVKHLDITRTEADKTLQQLHSFKGDNECELFVHVKDGKRLLNEAKGSLSKVSRSIRKESIYYEFDPKIEEFLESLETLGSLTGKPVTKTRQPENTTDIQTDTTDTVQKLQFTVDKEAIYACKMLILPSGIILVFYGNNELRAFDETNQPVSTWNVPRDIISLCSVGNNEAAVLYNRKMTVENRDVFIGKVGFVTGRKVLVMHRIFSTESKASGMVYSDGMLYVCCESNIRDPFEGGKMTKEIEGYHIAVYTELGQIQRYIPQSPLCFAEKPRQTIVGGDDELLFIDYRYYGENKVLCISDMSGNEVNSFDDIHLDGHGLICTTHRGQVFVCISNKKVVRFSVERQAPEVILSEADGIKDPKAICFDRNKSRLLVLCLESTSNHQMYTKYAYIVHSFNI